MKKKRLIVANNKAVNLIIDWINNGHYDIPNNEIDKIINDYRDCLYSGIGYRYMQFDFDSIFNLFGGYDVMEESNDNITKSEIINKINSLVNFDNKYCSFEKTLKGTMEFSESISNGYTASLIINANIYGLDLIKFLKRMQNEGFVNESVETNGYLDYNEIIAKIPNDFKIINFLKLDIDKWPDELTLSELAEFIYNNYIK